MTPDHPLAALLALPPAARRRLIADARDADVLALACDWGFHAHDGQVEPPASAGAGPRDWRTWVLMAGRGFGKTRAGAEWVWARVRGEGQTPGALSPLAPHPRSLRESPLPQAGGESLVSASATPGASHTPHPNPAPGQQRPALLRSGRGPDRPGAPEGEGLRIALVAATPGEARRVMVEGPSGLLATARPGERPEWSPSLGRLRFRCGSQAFVYSGAQPDALRGPEHDFAWCDELAKWARPEATWDMLQMGLRRGPRPRALVTTTPRPGAALEAILAAADTVVTGGPSDANAHVPPAWLAAMRADYAGTRLGRQELGGELLGEVAGALLSREAVERARVEAVGSKAVGSKAVGSSRPAQDAAAPLPTAYCLLPTLSRVVIGVDPPAGAGTCGIVACGLDDDGTGYVLGDHSICGVSPEAWARKAVAAAALWGAERLVAEGNQGGAMVESVLRGADALRDAEPLPVTMVHAREGKSGRAEGVAALIEAGRAKFAGRFPELEDELCGLLAAGGYRRIGRGGASPDRADACVWALRWLMLTPRAEPRVLLP